MSTTTLSSEDEFFLERRALGLSIIIGLLLAAVGIAIGITTGSQIILFDGFYTFLGIGLSWMAVRVSRLVESGPTSRYPFGREALTPLIIGVEGVALLATCAYATFNAILTIVGGGSKLPSGWGVGYACVALVLPTALWWWLRRTASHSELASAEATQWLAGGVLGLGMLVAFVFARLIVGTGWSPASRYVDPALVIVACLVFVVPPMRMIRTTFIELVEGRPDTDLAGPAREAVDSVCQQFGLGEQHLRMTKVGRKFYVEIDFVVDPAWTVRQSDQVRLALTQQLDLLPHDLWLTVEFTADRSWGE
jgi:predicted Co/Zn/Cd cation transporter (cation efflux family)